VKKLIQRLESMDEQLGYCKDLNVHRSINRFYYLQKAEELKILLEQMEESDRRLKLIAERIKIHYSEIFCTWRKQVRALSRHLHHTN